MHFCADSQHFGLHLVGTKKHRLIGSSMEPILPELCVTMTAQLLSPERHFPHSPTPWLY